MQCPCGSKATSIKLCDTYLFRQDGKGNCAYFSCRVCGLQIGHPSIDTVKQILLHLKRVSQDLKNKKGKYHGIRRTRIW